MDARKYLAELIGTFILVVVGSMSIVGPGDDPRPVLLVAVRLRPGAARRDPGDGPRLGWALQPGRDFGAFLDRRIDPMNAVGYVVAQAIGAIAASGRS